MRSALGTGRPSRRPSRSVTLQVGGWGRGWVTAVPIPQTAHGVLTSFLGLYSRICRCRLLAYCLSTSLFCSTSGERCSFFPTVVSRGIADINVCTPVHWRGLSVHLFSDSGQQHLPAGGVCLSAVTSTYSKRSPAQVLKNSLL